MRTVVLLGPQRLRPTLVEAVDRAGVTGAVAAVTAGWQEREDEIDELSAHLRRPVVNLGLHRRGEDVLARDPEFLLAYGDLLDRRRKLQDLYRIRLHHAKASVRDLLATSLERDLVEPEVDHALGALRALDHDHRQRVRRMDEAFDLEWRLASRPAVAEHREEVARILAGCDALAIAGGHVQVLLDRLRLFGVAEASGEKPVFAWSAGAMVVCDTVVLFHDSPPQGAGNAEVLDAGLGLARGVVALPHARRRLRLDDRVRVRLIAQRFAPARAFALDEGARVWCEGRRVEVHTARVLLFDGHVMDVGPA
ncbi:MAG: Type 1 glutamine amidotransferase-like domain-containing protein [Planctomycetota bacterium]